MVMERFSARHDYDLDDGETLLPLAQNWALGEVTERQLEMFWREDDRLFSVSSSRFYEPFSSVVRLSERIRIIDFAEEAWLLQDLPKQIPVVPYQSYVSDGIGVLLSAFTDAVWISPTAYWEVGRVAADGLEFFKITARGIAIGRGYDPSIGKVVRVSLDVHNQRILESAYC